MTLQPQQRQNLNNSQPEGPGAAPDTSASEARLHSDFWPFDRSNDAKMRISDVLAELKPEFPALTPSKLRFLEDQGLLTPVRTPAGYRKYSQAHVGRLAYILSQQRDNYLPLKVILQQLEDLDARGSAVSIHSLSAGSRHAEGANKIDVWDWLKKMKIPKTYVYELESLGVVNLDNRFPSPEVLGIIETAWKLSHAGLDARQIARLQGISHRAKDVLDHSLAASHKSQGAGARASLEQKRSELVESLAQLNLLFLRDSCQTDTISSTFRLN